jgi:hypothetical protein
MIMNLTSDFTYEFKVTDVIVTMDSVSITLGS